MSARCERGKLPDPRRERSRSLRRDEWVVALAIVAVVAGAAWLRFGPRSTPRASPNQVTLDLTTMALRESVAAMHARRDWRGAVRLGTALVQREPRRSEALCDLALAIHNLTLLDSATAYHDVRNSLGRSRFWKRAIALADSAARCATNLRDRVRAQRSLGSFYEILGLPLEALACHESILAWAPHDSVALARRFWVGTHLIDPQAPDFQVFRAPVDPLRNRLQPSRRR